MSIDLAPTALECRTIHFLAGFAEGPSARLMVDGTPPPLRFESKAEVWHPVSRFIQNNTQPPNRVAAEV